MIERISIDWSALTQKGGVFKVLYGTRVVTYAKNSKKIAKTLHATGNRFSVHLQKL